jgi:uncharacterized membrane-anchored protein
VGVTGPASVPQPGPFLVALDLHLLTEAGGAIAPERIFDRNSIAVTENSDGLALFATDFHTDTAGYVRVLVIDRGLGAERAGTQRIGLQRTRQSIAFGVPNSERKLTVKAHGCVCASASGRNGSQLETF